jgi:hypothetical protein
MQDLIKYITENPAASAAIMWPILSAVVNVMLKQHTVEEWIVFAEKRPRSAAVIRFFRSAGLDPKKAIVAAVAVINAKADKLNTPSQPRTPTAPPELPSA